MRPLILTTGGTIEATIDRDGYAPVMHLSRDFPALASIETPLTVAQWAQMPEIQRICQKDSGDLILSDRTALVEAIEQAFSMGQRAFIITHGTDTMRETALFLRDHLHGSLQESITVLLVGAMKPPVLMLHDAHIHLGFALGYLASPSPQRGIFIALHGEIMDPLTTQKDYSTLTFREQDRAS